MKSWLYLISHIAIATALCVLAGSSLYLFGIPLGYYLTFLMGLLLGIGGVIAYLFYFLLSVWDGGDLEGAAIATPKVEGKEEKKSTIVCQLLPQPQWFEEINNHRCTYKVWRDIGTTSYLQELNKDDANALFSNAEEDGFEFSNVLDAVAAANACYLMYAGQYKFAVEIAEVSVKENVQAN